MRYQRIAEMIYYRPWIITPTGHAAVRAVFEQHTERSGADENWFSDLINPRPDAELDSNGIAHLHLIGVVAKGLSRIEKACGNTDVMDLRSEFLAAQEQGARGIMLYVNSPGGTVTGVPELGRLIDEIDKTIPVFAFTDDLMASAAYWLSASARQIWATPSSEVGSIGVYIPWVDQSIRWKNAGLKADPIVNTGGDLKAIGFAPSLTESQREHLQESVDETFEQFISHIANMRGMPDPSALRGQTLSGRAAMQAGLVDYLGEEQDAYDTLLALANS